MNSRNWLPDTTISLAFTIFVLFIGMGLVLYHFESGTWSQGRTTVWVRAIAGLGTILLVFAYIHQLIEDRQVRDRERERNIHRVILNDIIRPTIPILAHNRGQFLEMDTEIGFPMEHEVPGQHLEERVLYRICERDDLERFGLRPLEEEYPELHERMEQHDLLLSSFDIWFSEVAQNTIHNEEFLEELPESMRRNAEDNEFRLLTLFLSDFRPRQGTEFHKDWVQHHGELKQAFREHGGEELEKFLEQKENYIDLLFDLSDELIELRDEIRWEYGLE